MHVCLIGSHWYYFWFWLRKTILSYCSLVQFPHPFPCKLYHPPFYAPPCSVSVIPTNPFHPLCSALIRALYLAPWEMRNKLVCTCLCFFHLQCRYIYIEKNVTNHENLFYCAWNIYLPLIECNYTFSKYKSFNNFFNIYTNSAADVSKQVNI